MLAATADACGTTALLLQRGADIEARNAACRTPLFLAAVSGSPGAAALLIQAGAQVHCACLALAHWQGRQRTTASLPPDCLKCAPPTGGRSRGRPRLHATRCRYLPSGCPGGVRAAAAFHHVAALLREAGADVGHAARGGSRTPRPSCILHQLQHGTPVASAEAVSLPRPAPQPRAAPPCCSQLQPPVAQRPAPLRAPQASRVLACLAEGERAAGVPGGGSAGGSALSVVTVWQLLAVVNAGQLRTVAACPAFLDLPHTDAPEEALPLAALGAMLEVGRWWGQGTERRGSCLLAAACCPFPAHDLHPACTASGPWCRWLPRAVNNCWSALHRLTALATAGGQPTC